jgi:hypothetical protein
MSSQIEENRMKNITSLDRTSLRLISAEMETALAGIAAKYGISIEKAGGTFGYDNAIVKFKLAVSRNGKFVTKERTDFETYAACYGLSPKNLGKQFTYGTQKFEIIGLNSRAKRTPILGRELGSGKTYRFPAETVKAGL